MSRTASQVPEEEMKQIADLYVHGEKTVELMRAYDLVNTSAVILVLKKLGVPLRPQKSGGIGPKQSLEEEIVSTRRKLQELEEKRKLLAIKFEQVDDTTLTIYGVTESFIKLEGIAMLREFITHKFPQRA